MVYRCHVHQESNVPRLSIGRCRGTGHGVRELKMLTDIPVGVVRERPVGGGRFTNRPYELKTICIVIARSVSDVAIPSNNEIAALLAVARNDG